MENSANALLIAGGILIAMLILSMGVYLFVSYSDLGTSYEKTLEENEIQKFNANFNKFEGRTDITIQEIITLANFAREYEEKTGIKVAVQISGITSDLTKINDPKEIVKKIKENSLDENNSIKKFELVRIEYDENEKLVNKIVFK